MSVVFGIYNREIGAIGGSSIQAMDDALAYWDADESGEWSEGSVFLGHRMLWNTPESKLDHLPRHISPNNQTLVITIDARLDNREVLAEQLRMTDLPLEQITDSELILAAYRKWGEACPKYLLGDFVFVIWDAAKEQLFCARDHIGIKPFYYHLSDDLFVFSSDIRGVIAHPKVSEKYNERSMTMFSVSDLGFWDEKDTFFESIQKLPAATSMTITKEHLSESVYWSIENIPEVHYDTYDEYVEKLRELLLDAVKVRLRTAYPVASHLSGGLDSSAIAVLAARELEKRKQPLYAFNWVETPTGKYDPSSPEWGFAAQLESLENIEQKNIKLTAEFVAEMYDKVNIGTDDITYYWEEYLVREEAEKYKVRTLLSGWGGDDLISYDGYAYLSGLFWQGHFVKAVREIADINKDRKYRYLRTIKRSLREMLYPIFYKRMYGLYQGGKPEFDLFEFTQEPFTSIARGYSFEDTGFRPGAHNEQKALFASGHIVQRIENWGGSALEKKLEYRYPLLDKRIVEFALAVPEELYARREGHQRYFFRSAISDYVPENIIWEEKISEPEHHKVWMRLRGDAVELWMKKNGQDPKNRNRYMDFSKITNRIKLYFKNQQNGIEDNFGNSRSVALILLSILKDKECSSDSAA